MLQGSMVALVTPMTADNAIDWVELDALVEWHIAQGTNAIVAVGTSGESATLSVDEHTRVVKAVVDKVNRRIPVIAGTGANSTTEAIELTQNAKDVGADACLLVTPYYNKPTQEGLFQHHVAIAEAVDIPQLLYNVPGRTAVDMLPETVLRLAAIKNIIGVKEATGDLARAKQLIKDAPKGFLILSGDDESALDLILLGGKGSISVTANVATKLDSEVCRLGIAGDAEGARALNKKLTLLNKALFLESNPIPVKCALNIMGKIGTGIRLPLTPLADAFHAPLRAAMAEAEVI